MPPERRRRDQSAVPQLGEESPIEDMPLGFRVAGGMQLRDQNVLRDESGRRRGNAAGALQQKRRGDDQHTRHRDLPGHQRSLATATARHPGVGCSWERGGLNRRHHQQAKTDEHAGRAGDGQHPERDARWQGY